MKKAVFCILSAVGLFGLIATAAAAPVLPGWAVVACFCLSGWLNVYFANRFDNEK